MEYPCTVIKGPACAGPLRMRRRDSVTRWTTLEQAGNQQQQCRTDEYNERVACARQLAMCNGDRHTHATCDGEEREDHPADRLAGWVDHMEQGEEHRHENQRGKRHEHDCEHTVRRAQRTVMMLRALQ